jgi:hypothetical protein
MARIEPEQPDDGGALLVKGAARNPNPAPPEPVGEEPRAKDRLFLVGRHGDRGVEVSLGGGRLLLEAARPEAVRDALLRSRGRHLWPSQPW